MSIELKDGTFTPIEILSDSLLTKFKDFADAGQAVALHVGTEEWLNRRMKQRNLENEVDELKQRIDALEPAHSDTLLIPTMDEIKTIMEKI